MADSGEKIVIRPEDLSPETDEPFVIAGSDLEEAVSTPQSAPTSPPRWQLAVITLVPLWNAWAWWRLPVQGWTGNRLAKAFAVILAIVSGICLAGLAFLVIREPITWIERVARVPSEAW